jgi:PAS domain S-box-containing protein
LKDRQPVLAEGSRLLNTLGLFLKVNTAVVVFAALFILAGWHFDIDQLKYLLPLSQVINPLTAVGFILSGIVVMIMENSRPKRNAKRIARVLSLLVIAIGLTKIFEYLGYVEFSIDQLLFEKEIKASVRETSHGLMSANSAALFLLTGLALLCIDRKPFLSQALSFISTSITFLALIGFIHNMPQFFIPFQDSFNPVSGTICFLLLSISTLVARRSQGYMAEIMSPYSGGRIARNLLPMLLVAPFILELFRLYGEKSGLYSSNYGIVLFFCAVLGVSLLMILNSVKVANRIDYHLAAEIEERERAKAEIKQNTLFLETVLENIPNMIFVKEGEELRFIAINKAGEQILRVPRNEYVGKTDEDLFPPQQAAYFKQMDRSVFENGSVVIIEEEPVQTQDGERWLRTKKIPVKDEHGRPLYLIGISEDITEKREKDEQIKQFYAELEKKVKERTIELSNSEKRFRALIENSTDGITMTTASSKIVYESPAVERMTGFSLREKTRTRMFDHVHPDDVLSCRNYYGDLIRNPGVPMFQQYRIMKKDGTYIWIEGTATNFLNDDGVRAIIFNYRDITDRKRHEQERELLIQELTRHNKDLRQFSYITSHNLRAPLSNLLGLLELIKFTKIEDQSLNEIIRGFDISTNSLNDTINDLLDILYIKENTSVELEEVPVGQLFDKLLGQISTNIDEVKPVLDIDLGNDITIVFSKAYLESIFLNLLTNAIKYRSPDRRLKITVRLTEHHDKTIITFRDNGIGIDLERCRTKVFGLYQRFHNHPDSKGLGLYLVKTQVEAFGGKIDIDSAVDEGTVFTLTFNKIYAEQSFIH